ncbi:MAG: nitroreductase family deazaflavin-dependent oxidoreductase [Anaerolineae bacterium]
MPFARWLRQTLKHTLNPITLRLARSGHGPFSLVRHVGRRSGRHYETPLIVGRDGACFVAELTYGPQVDWYQNVLAAGGCTLIWRGEPVEINQLEPMRVEEGRAAFPLPARLLLRLMRRRHYVRLCSRVMGKADRARG